MSDYTLYYWPIPFRGQFIRWVLAHAGRTWDEADPSAVAADHDDLPSAQPLPHMAPPMLRHEASGQAMAQMPAVLMWLGETLELLPASRAGRAMTLKVICDANDVLDEMTWNGGQRMWDSDAWSDYRPRLKRWAAIFEDQGRRGGLTPGAGTLLGTPEPGLADLVAGALWFTMVDKLPALRPPLEEAAPAVMALADRLAASDPVAALRAETDARWGTAWCGGRIEASLRAVLG